MYRTSASLLFVLCLSVGAYGVFKPLPEGLSFESVPRQVTPEEVVFFADRTFIDSEGNSQKEHEIFDEMLKMVREAHSYILVDVFFYSDFIGTAKDSHRSLSQEFTDALIAKKEDNPKVDITVITDPINTVYGGYEPEHHQRLVDAGISVILTDLRPLRDSNPAYSALWRTFIQWFGVSSKGGSMANLFDVRKPDVPFRSYLASLNFKANHRKLLVTNWRVEGKEGYSTLITSANPHDGSSANSNVALRIDGAIAKDVIASESAVAALSGVVLPIPDVPSATVRDLSSKVAATLLTERAIESRALALINGLEAGDSLDMAMFYFSDRSIVRALKDAGTRGVTLRLLLDPNKDAFGRKKNGIPNRQVAHELFSHSSGTTHIRWCDTHGEQCHSKMLLITKKDSNALLQGSANFTRRNLDNFNLETDVLIEGSHAAVFTDARHFFNEMWENQGGRSYSVPYEAYADSSMIKTLQYRLMEATGMSHF